jgi:hypothetical protein
MLIGRNMFCKILSNIVASYIPISDLITFIRWCLHHQNAERDGVIKLFLLIPQITRRQMLCRLYLNTKLQNASKRCFCSWNILFSVTSNSFVFNNFIVRFTGKFSDLSVQWLSCFCLCNRNLTNTRNFVISNVSVFNFILFYLLKIKIWWI